MPDTHHRSTGPLTTERTDATLPAMASPPSVPANDPNCKDPSYIVEVGGQCVSQFGSLTAALSAGLALKSQNALAQVKVYDARDRATA